MPRPHHRSARHAVLALATCAAALALADGASGAAARTAPPARATVVIRDIAFHARTVVVRRGGSVTWQWRDGTAGANAISHNVTSVGAMRFRTAATRNHGSTTRTFSRAGAYRYECTIHLGMTGRVVVR